MTARVSVRSARDIFGDVSIESVMSRRGRTPPPLPSRTLLSNEDDEGEDDGAGGEHVATSEGHHHITVRAPRGGSAGAATLERDEADIAASDVLGRGDRSGEDGPLSVANTSDAGVPLPLLEDGVMSISEDDDLPSDGASVMGGSGDLRGEEAVAAHAAETTSDAHTLGRSTGDASEDRRDSGLGALTAHEGRGGLAAVGRSSPGASGPSRPRRRGASLDSSGMRSGLSRKFVRSLIRHLCLRADSRQREELRAMVETLKDVANQPGVDMRQELKREAVSLLGPELAREAFEASLSETRNEFLRQRTIAAAAAAEAATQELELSAPIVVDGMGPGEGVGGGGGGGAPSGGAAAGVVHGSNTLGGGGSASPPRRRGAQPRRGAHPHPRKRKSFGVGNGADSDGEEAGGPGVSAPPFYLMPEEEVEQRLKAIHKGPQHEDFHLCCICMDRTRDAAIIHGKTAHQACCYECASELFEQGLPCPCCRQPITCVVKNYL